MYCNTIHRYSVYVRVRAKYVFAACCPRCTPKRMAVGREVASKYLELVERGVIVGLSGAHVEAHCYYGVRFKQGHLDATLLPSSAESLLRGRSSLLVMFGFVSVLPVHDDRPGLALLPGEISGMLQVAVSLKWCCLGRLSPYLEHGIVDK